MSDTTTKTLLSPYVQGVDAPMFLSSFFKARTFHKTEEVEIDIQRSGEDVAVAIQDLTVDPRMNQSNVYTSKTFKPVIFSEAAAVNSWNLIKRRAGQSPLADPDFQANAMDEAKDLGIKLTNKIRRSIELMASQVFQAVAVITLIDGNGNTVYSIDFKAKAAHFANAGVSWATVASSDPFLDIKNLADVIRKNGRSAVKRAIFGGGALNNFFASAKVKDTANFRRVDNIAIGRPQGMDEGASFLGTMSAGDHNIEVWTYSGRYVHPQTGTITDYVNTDKVILLGDERLDLTYGDIPMIVPPEQRALPFLPARVSDASRGVDIHLNSYVTQNNRTLMIEASARPLTIPTAIDSFGCLETTP